MRTRLISVLACTVIVLGLTTGCSAAAPDITDEKAEQFQSRVLAVTSAVADGGYAAALEALTALQAELDAAAADGSLSFARHQRIEAAMALVRADIQAAIDAAAVPAPTPQETTAPVQQQPAPEPDTETEAERKAREAAEKAAEKAAEDAAKKAEEDARKAAEEAKKKAEDEAKKNTPSETPPSTEEPQGKKATG